MPRILTLGAETIDAVSHEMQVVLRRGGIVALPTESFYALAADPANRTALKRIFNIKGRQHGKPLLVLIGHHTAVTRFVCYVPPAAKVLMEHFWPGPLTLVMPAAALPEELTGGAANIGVREVGRDDLRRLLQAVGPVTGTSANRSGDPAARTADEVLLSLGDEVDLIVDGGRAPAVVPSTLVDTREPVVLLRHGAIRWDRIVAVLERSGIVVREFTTGEEGGTS